MVDGWIDISVPLKSGMVHWPGDPEVRIERVLAIERGDKCNVSSVVMGSHTGTHMDPPFHHALLEAGIWIIEGLNLADVEPGLYELVCMPLKILHADGAPARAALRPRLAGDR